MSAEKTVASKRKIRPARKQVAPGDIDKSEGPQPGKEYSKLSTFFIRRTKVADQGQMCGTTSGLEEIKKMRLQSQLIS